MSRKLFGILMVVMFASCATTRTGRQPAPKAELLSHYDNSQLPFYYHSEGIKQAYIYGDYPAAVESFHKAIEADSTYDPAYFSTSKILLSLSPVAALQYADKAVELDSTNLTYKSQLARTMVMSGEYDEALRLYNKLTVEDPHNVLNYSMLAVLYDLREQPFTAISVLDSAEYKLGRIDELSAYKLQLLIDVKLFDRAVEETKARIVEYPYDDNNYVILGSLYASMGRDSLALANYNEALSIDSTSVGALMSLADYYNGKGNSRNYLTTVRRIFELDEVPLDTKMKIFEDVTVNIDYYRNNYFYINNLATTLMLKYPTEYSVVDMYAGHLIRSGELHYALALYKSYLEGNPDEIKPYYAVMDIEGYLMRADSVAKYSDMALELYPRDTELYLRKGFAMTSMGKDKEALETYEKALKYAGTDSVKSVVLGIIGDLYYNQGKTSKCYSTYDKALRLDPDNVTVLNNYAYFLSEEGRSLEKALAMSVRANELRPTNPTFLDTHGWILYKMGRYEEAKRIMMQAISFDRSGSDVLLLHYGDILYALGDYFMATTYWRRALEKGYDAEEIEKRLKLPGI